MRMAIKAISLADIVTIDGSAITTGINTFNRKIVLLVNTIAIHSDGALLVVKRRRTAKAVHSIMVGK